MAERRENDDDGDDDHLQRESLLLLGTYHFVTMLTWFHHKMSLTADRYIELRKEK